MSFKDRVENNLVVFMLGTLLAGFMAGIGVYKGILGIAQLQAVPTYEYTKLKQEVASASANADQTLILNLKAALKVIDTKSSVVSYVERVA